MLEGGRTESPASDPEVSMHFANRRSIRTPFAGAALALVAAVSVGPAAGLERAIAPAPPERADEWERSGCTSSVAYYNICTGWVFIWSDWSPGDRVAVTYDVRPPTGWVCDVPYWHFRQVLYFWTGSPPGYGFTGTLELHETDASGCVTVPPLASHSLLPTTGWNYVVTGDFIPPGFAVSYVFGPGPGNPAAVITDAPEIDGACGSCFPETRTTRSFTLGSGDPPPCPGEPFQDGSVCTAELVWAAVGTFLPAEDDPVSVESSSWGGLKSLYR
jgi:hypothetical protein